MFVFPWFLICVLVVIVAYRISLALFTSSAGNQPDHSQSFGFGEDLSEAEASTGYFAKKGDC